MDTKFEIVKFGMLGFNKLLDSFISTSKTNPIYSSPFSDYYRELNSKSEENTSLLISLSKKTILGLLFSTPASSEKKNYKMSYFGLPSALIVSETATVEEINEATQILLQELNDSSVLVANGRISIPHIFHINTTALRSNKIEKLFFSNANVTPRFDRIIDLTRAPELIRSEYSKSVREALKNQSMEIKVTTSESNQESIEHEFKSLRKLHLLSAGRTTRSDESWGLQLEMILNGSGLIVSGSIKKTVLTSAFFMINSGAAFYGVSASEPNNRRGLSHQLIDFAIQEFKGRGVNEIWMGTQHTSSVFELSNKEKQIEEFKGYFGGSIHTSLLARAEL